jgi:hypothetical protein
MSITRAQIARQLYARGGNTGYSDFASPSSSTASQDFATQAVSGGQTDYGGGGGGEDSFNKNLNRINTGLRSAGAVNNVKNAIASKGLLSFPAALAMSELYHLLNSNKNQTAINNLELLKSGLAQGGRAGYAYGGRGYSDYASPSSTTAQIATQLLNEMAPKGEKLAYINNREAELLKRMGGAGKNINETGIKSYYYDEVGQTMGGTGFQDTSSLTGGSGDGGGGSYDYIPQPTVAKLNTINTSDRGGDTNPYGLRSKFQRGLDKALPYLAGFIGSKLGLYPGYKAYDAAKTNVEKQQEELNQFINAPITGSFYVPGQTGLPEGLIAKSDSLLGFQNRAPEPTIPTFTGGDSQPIKLPIIAEAPSDVDGTLSDFDLYMQNLRTAQPNPFMLDPRFAAAQGGVARQAYGLGSLVRKITRPIKKILKSDVGKAALLYGLGTYLGGTTAFGGSGKSSFFQRFKDPKLLKNLRSPQFLTSGETTSALSTVTPTTGADAVIAPFGRLNLEAATAAAEAVKPTPTLIDKAVTYAIEKPVPTIFGLSSLAALSAAGEEDESLDGITSREDDSGLKELIARYPELRFQVQKPYQLAANGGRMGYEEGGNINPADLPMSKEGFPTYEDIETGEEVEYPYENKEMSSAPDIDAELFQMYLDAIGSGKIPRSTTFDQYKELMGETASMGPERTMANEGGLMNLGGNEMDLRGGGFVPLGAREKADDVPARLSKNEFVFTADAVKAAGGGDVDRGANLMYKTMKNLESRVG